jgi:hypothetical protein
MKNKLLIFILSLLPVLYAGCEDDPTDSGAAKQPYDPNSPVTVDRFTPDSGGAATQMMIYGSNFGTDVTNISLTVGDKSAAVMSSSGSALYALIPSQIRTDTGLCKVTLRVGDKEINCGEFYYMPKWMVSTIIGDFVDEKRGGAVVDGTFEEARFDEPYWLAFDKQKNLYLIEENNGLRYIDFKTRKVSTKFRTGGGFDRPRTIAFTQGYDTMIIANDAGNWDNMGHAMLTSTDNFTQWTPVLKSRQCNGGAFHPVHYDYYFNTYEDSRVYKVTNRSSIPWSDDVGSAAAPPKVCTTMFTFGEKAWEFNIQFAPSGNFAYLVSINQHYIGKATYDWNKRELVNATQQFVGGRSQSGYLDGSGTNARFERPHQGAFDEKDNFYLCDALNQCIRKITPDGVVTTWAGRPDEYGIVDGDLRTAQFDQPWGIVYDKDSSVFYVADQKNRRIRKITFE